MSDTPKSDAAELGGFDGKGRIIAKIGVVHIDFARQQERRIAELEKDVANWKRTAEIEKESAIISEDKIVELEEKLARYEENKTFGEAAHAGLQKCVDSRNEIEQAVDDDNQF